MEENKFFRYVWRINGMIFLFVGFLAIFVLAFAGYKILKETTETRNVRNIVNVQENEEVDEKWQLGYMTNISGTPFIMISLNSDQSYAQSYYSKSSSSNRNYLFINNKNNEMHWLYKTNDYLIAESIMLGESGTRYETKNVKAVLYKVIKEDSNNDHRLTTKDKLTVALSTPDGKNYKEILHGIDLFNGYRKINSDSILIIYQRNGIGFSAIVDLLDFKISNKTELIKVGL